MNGRRAVIICEFFQNAPQALKHLPDKKKEGVQAGNSAVKHGRNLDAFIDCGLESLENDPTLNFRQNA